MNFMNNACKETMSLKLENVLKLCCKNLLKRIPVPYFRIKNSFHATPNKWKEDKKLSNIVFFSIWKQKIENLYPFGTFSVSVFSHFGFIFSDYKTNWIRLFCSFVFAVCIGVARWNDFATQLATYVSISSRKCYAACGKNPYTATSWGWRIYSNI